jgi:hypothetical protein
VAGGRRDHPARVELEPVRELPETARLLVRGAELVRDPAGEPVPERVAGPVVGDAVCAGALVRLVRGAEVWVAVEGAGVQEGKWLVLA